MQSEQSVVNGSRRFSSSWPLVILLLGLVVRAEAQNETLNNFNSTVNLNPSSAGTLMSSWNVDGQNQLANQSFYYRVGNSGTAASVGSLTLTSVTQPTASSLDTLYTSAGQFSLEVVYSLVGGAAGSGTADLSEQIKIQNLTCSALQFNFFQYANFQLGGPSQLNNQTVQLFTNRKGLYNEALVSSGSMSLTENVDSAISPGANRGEAGLFPNTLNQILNTPGYNLNDIANSGLGDPTWALEWSNNIAANGSLIISKDLNISGLNVTPAPEPGTWALLTLGLATCVVGRRSFGRRSL